MPEEAKRQWKKRGEAVILKTAARISHDQEKAVRGSRFKAARHEQMRRELWCRAAAASMTVRVSVERAIEDADLLQFAFDKRFPDPIGGE